MLQRLYILWHPFHLYTVSIFLLVSLACGELLALWTSSSLDSDLDVPLHIRSYALPNYWIWYDGQEIIRALVAHVKNFEAYIYLILFNAIIASPIVGVWHLLLLMVPLVRAAGRNSPWLWLWIVPAMALILDVVEDMGLLVVSLGYPSFEYPLMLRIIPWCSFGKFALWLATYYIAIVAVVKRWKAQHPQQHEHN